MSILDNDLYKFSMQQAVLKLYPDTLVKYAFTNRAAATHSYTRQAFERLSQKLQTLDSLQLSKEEFDWLKEKCPYFTQEYLEYLKGFRFNTSKHLQLAFNNDSLEITISGPWIETILYEVPVMSIVSETFFEQIDKDWSINGQYERAFEKGKTLIESGCVFSEFGTRRRRNFETQDIVMNALVDASNKVAGTGSLAGTSNVFFAKKYNLKPVGTVAHEWTMAVSALEKDILHANRNALLKWSEAYPTAFHTALTDTFGTKAFFDDFDLELANLYDGLRQDSGDPIVFLENAIKHYTKLGIEPTTKTIVYSDSLNVEKCKLITEKTKQINGPKAVFGIGTFFTNDYSKLGTGNPSKAMNIVIKLVECNGVPVVKLSDDPKKHQGKKEAVEEVLQVFGFKTSANEPN